MEFRKINMNNVNVAMADGGGGGTASSGDDITFNAAAISEKLTSIITDAGSAFDALKALTGRVDQAVGAGGVLRGAVGDIQTDWQAFQAEYKNFLDTMERVKVAVQNAGNSYDTFNSSLGTTFAKKEGQNSVQKPSSTNATYGGGAMPY